MLIERTQSLERKHNIYQSLHLKFFGRDQQKSLDYALMRLEIANKISDKKYRISANNAIGWYLTNSIEKPDEAAPYLERALADALEVNDSNGIATALTYTGFMYQMKSYYRNAMDYYLQAVAYREELDTKRELAFNYNLIGKVYEFQDQFDKSLEYHYKALDIRKKYVDSLQVAHSLKNIGWTYFRAGDYQNSIKAFNHSARLAEGFNHKRRMSFAYNGLGSNYLALEQADTAMYYFKKGLALSRSIDIDFNVSQALVGIGNAWLMKNELGKAENRAEEAIILTRNHRYYEQLQDAYDLLYQVTSRRGNNAKALEYFKASSAIGDSIASAETQAQIAEMELRFNTAKKEKQLTQLQAENDRNLNMLAEEKSRKQRIIIITTAMAIMLLLVFIFLRKSLLQQRELVKTIDQKNMLVKEVHHRVKNSFQIVSGLLYLQATKLKSPEVNSALNEVQNRIDSMVLLHQKLYKEDSPNGVNIEEYMKVLVTNIITSHSYVAPIEKRLNVQPLILDIETTSSIGLIVNELVTNSIKHAFTPQFVDPYIEISLESRADQLILIVSDNGSGFIENNDDTMGLVLIKDLANKLQATVHFDHMDLDRRTGTKVELVITKFMIL